MIRSSTNAGQRPSAEFRLASNFRFLEPLGEGNRERADVFPRVTLLASKGAADMPFDRMGQLTGDIATRPKITD